MANSDKSAMNFGGQDGKSEGSTSEGAGRIKEMAGNVPWNKVGVGAAAAAAVAGAAYAATRYMGGRESEGSSGTGASKSGSGKSGGDKGGNGNS
jgi:hypothetical protein